MAKEAKARLKINEQLSDAGWILLDRSGEKANVVVEGNVDFARLGDDFEGTTGFMDYLLLDKQGMPLAVLEAKAESKDPTVGKEKASNYAKAKNCRFVLLSNGNSHYFWDLTQSAEEAISKLPSQAEILKLVHRQSASKLSTLKIDENWIAESQGNVGEEDRRVLRDYQLDAMNVIANKFDKGERKFLLEMATGTGKTLLAAAVIKMFLKTGNANRVLFLVDRIELADQALQNISGYLKEYTIGIFKDNKEEALYKNIVIATIQSLGYEQNYSKYFGQFDFDLLISDEAHRSIYGANRAILDYFQCPRIGLTATPKDYLKGINEKIMIESDPRLLEKRILLDTYVTFGCPSGEPTFRFDLKAAVSHKPPYLVNPIVYDKRSANTDQMLSDDGWKDVFVDSITGIPAEETFGIRQLERKVFSEVLNKLLVSEFVKVAKRDPITQEIGKTIIYCISQNHASKIARYLNEYADQHFPSKYSGYTGTFARQITSNIESSQELSKKFRNNQLGSTRIVVTVNMMTTGYDCPDLLNVVLMRPIYSVSDFVQIKGRGTRLNTFQNKLTGAKVQKENFHLIDFFGVCDYFEEEYDYQEPLVLTGGLSKVDPVTPPEPVDEPISVVHGDLIYVGTDFMIRDNQIIVGDDCMKVDREAYRQEFEGSINRMFNESNVLADALNNGDVETVENFLMENLLEKPKYYFSLNTLQKVYGTENTLIDFVKKAAGLVASLPSKYDKYDQSIRDMRLAFSKVGHQKLDYFENILQCYETSSDYRHQMDKGNLSVLSDQTLGGIVPIDKVTKEDIQGLLGYIRTSKLNV